jgi:hypothetical protein
LQHAPVAAAGQVLGPHATSSPLYSPPPETQFVSVLVVHLVELQHAPVAGQALASQMELSPWYCPLPAEHADWVTVVQFVPLQQAPVAAHGFDAHKTSSP